MITHYPQTWEHHLITLATEARRPVVAPVAKSVTDEALLDHAYAYCDAVTATHSKTFYVATSLLPFEKRRAVRALYAFCRVADNIVDVDCSEGDGGESLADWRRRALSTQPSADDPIATAWTDTRMRFKIPTRYAEQLIEGVGRDLCQKRYATFGELAEYAYGVASTVGLMSMYIIGFSSNKAIPYAVKLGVALQMTNILRDVGEDWRAGRIYLPLEELAAFGLAEEDVANGRVDERWRALMRFQITRNRQLYAEALPGIRMLNPDGRFAVAAAGELYRAILDDIEAHDYGVFNRRAHVSTLGKLARLPGIWWRSR
jgi:15-cis-phytoene synthase